MPSAHEPHRWWADRPDEIFWFETTDRSDFGQDLNAPQFGEEGRHWSYDFVTEVNDGDVVVHYRTRPNKEIIGWSRAVGTPYADQVTWGAHGQASGRGPVDPYDRPGWRIGLEGPFLLDEPVPLDRLRELEPELRAVRDALQSEVGSPIYFPFAFSETRSLRATQFYLTKVPRSLLLAVPELAEMEATSRESAPSPEEPSPLVTSSELGTEYRREDENIESSGRGPFSTDPSVVERGLRGHKRTQNALADYVRSQDLDPRSSAPGEPSFDLAWEEGDRVFVAEVKSLTLRNEEKQLRLGLGQVLRYQHQLEARGHPVTPVLAVEREPSDGSWLELGHRLGVLIDWPPDFSRLDSAA